MPLPNALDLPYLYKPHDSGAAFGEKMHLQLPFIGVDHARYALDAVVDEHFQHRSVKEEVEFYKPVHIESGFPEPPCQRYVQPVAFSANEERFVGA